MATPRKGTAQWIEAKLLDLADRVESGSMEPMKARVITDIYKQAYHTRISRAIQDRDGKHIEDYLKDEGEDQPELQLIEGQKIA